MNQPSELEIVATDVTGQRGTRWTVFTNTLWGAVTSQAVEMLNLPTAELATHTPIVYHCFEDSAGELLPAEESVADVIERYQVDLEVRVRIVPELEAA